MEVIIFNYLKKVFDENSNEDKKILATYLEEQAVFNTKAPDDVDEGWKDGVQYPRCIFELNMQADAERKISGRLYVDVMCENENNSVQPESLAELVKQAVDGCFFSKTDLTISAQWNRSDNFAEKDSKLSGITLTFDILAYPIQETESPDPVKAVNLWLKTLYSDAYVIGRDTLPETWKPTDKSPAIYCRISNLGESSRMKSTAAVTWIGADMRVNVMAPSEQVRSTIIKNSIQILTNATRLILDDKSPMLIDRVTGNPAADALREGQIQIKTTYGVLNTYTGTPIKSIRTSGLDAEMEVNHGETE